MIPTIEERNKKWISQKVFFELDDALHFMGKTREDLGDIRIGWRRIVVDWRKFKTAYRKHNGKEYKVKR